MLLPAQPQMPADAADKIDSLSAEITAHADPDHTDPYDDALLAATFGLINLFKGQDAELRAIQKTLRKLARER